MTSSWDDIDLSEFSFEEEEETYKYPCPCGDSFFITVQDLLDGEDLAPCPSCSLLLRVVYDPDAFLASIEEFANEEEQFVFRTSTKSEVLQQILGTSINENDDLCDGIDKVSLNTT